MNGFEIYYNGNAEKVAVEDGMITINVFTISGNNNDSRLYVGGIDHKKCEKYVWFDWHPIIAGDKFRIRVVDVDEISMPEKIETDPDMNQPQRKLEFFRQMENRLKDQGLL